MFVPFAVETMGLWGPADLQLYGELAKRLMDSYLKADFSPPILSRRWIAIKFRPNMLIYNRKHIISILESGLLFREDSAEVEQEAPAGEAVWALAGGSAGGWLTAGEAALVVAATAAALAARPPHRLDRSILVNMLAYASIPVVVRTVHRARCSGGLPSLLANLRDYIALARRAAACLKEYSALYNQLMISLPSKCSGGLPSLLANLRDYIALVRRAAACLKEYSVLYNQLSSVMSVAESVHVMLCRQQHALCVGAARASLALCGAAPWVHAAHHDLPPRDKLTEIHHAFLVIQSTLLKNIALAHCVPPPHVRKLYNNHNERIYFIHNVLLQQLNEELKENLNSLQRMYRLLKSSTTRDNGAKKLGVAISQNWVYSDVHNGVARACLELKVALDKSNSLDVFLDSCAMHNEKFDLNILNKDIDDLIDNVTKCLTTLQNSQLRLKKLKGKTEEEPQVDKEKDLIESAAILKIEDKEPEIKDEVFYFVKTEDDSSIQPTGDVTTVPGKREKETTKIVLSELKRKLGKREDLMRERERQALVKTMPELKNVPEFPRQIKFDEFYERKGYIKKIQRAIEAKKSKLFRRYKIESKPKIKHKKYNMTKSKYAQESAIKGQVYEANSHSNVKSRLVTVTSENDSYIVTRWFKSLTQNQSLKDFDSSGLSEGYSDEEAGASNRNVNQAVNSNEMRIKFSKKELELTASSSASDTEYYQEQRQLLKDVRRHRVARRKNHPGHKAKVATDKEEKTVDNVDESLKPIEYSFGTGLAMASVLQVNNPRFMNMAQEEVFVGDGEVSDDSGNDEDA